MPVILTDLLHKDHTARLCSKTGIVTICILVLTFALPFIVVVLTHSKYTIANSMKRGNIKIHIDASLNYTDPAHYFCVDYFDWTSSYYEQPNITHLNEFLIYL